MSLGDEAGMRYDAATARGREWPSVRQFNVFLSNRLGRCSTFCAASSRRTFASCPWR